VKLHYKLLLFILVASVAAPFVLRDRDGHPLMSIHDMRLPEIALPDTNGLKDAVRAARNSTETASDEVHANTGTKTSAKIYRWQDEEGGWHFANSAPGERGATEIAVDTSVNVMQMESAAPARDPAANTTSKDTGAGSTATSISALLPLSQAVDVMQDARRVSMQLEARHERQAKAIGD
jgi:hypothetical protein